MKFLWNLYHDIISSGHGGNKVCEEHSDNVSTLAKTINGNKLATDRTKRIMQNTKKLIFKAYQLQKIQRSFRNAKDFSTKQYLRRLIF